MFKNIRGLFSRDLSIDLGTANTLIYVREQGIVLNEPSVVAIRMNGNQKSVAAVGLDAENYVVQDPHFMRPAEVDLLVGDPQKASERLGWQPETTFEELVKIMVKAELEEIV